ncbi:hypothetical protein BDR26DRAFT_857213 [Obelidium mucronatum]|nr:hypothetical protein BDR26DRAFT_857213 [Obelidium mucronatum]
MTTVQGLPQSGEPGSGPTGDSSDGQLSGSGDVNSAGGVLITATVKSAGGPVINSPSSTPVTIGSSASSESGSGSGLGIGIGLALIVLAVGGFVFAKKQRQRKEVAAAPDSTFPSEYTAAPVQKAIITPAYAAPIPTAGAAAVITAGVIPSAKRSILFLYDTDYTPSAQICQEIEHVLWAKLAARQRVVATRRLGLQGLPEDIQLFQLGEFDSIVLVLRKAERFKIYREGKIFDRLQDLCGSKLITVIFDVVMQNGNMDAQRHDGFPLVYFSAADRKVVPTRENDDTLTQLAEQLL